MPTTPNKDQATILQAPNKVILINAVAGAGKTTTLAMVAGQALAEGKSAAGMIGLCFSRGARMRFQEKLREEAEGGAAVFVMTLEDLARKLIEDLAKRELINLPRLCRDVEEIRGQLVAAAGRVWQRYSERGVGSDFDFQFDENNQHIADLATQLAQMKASLLTHELGSDMSDDDELDDYADLVDRPRPELEIIREYENWRHPYLDEFVWQGPHDAVSDLVYLLKRRPELGRELYRWQLILVDEWHDVNAAEFELMKLLRRGARLVVVGDKDQTINTDRGADPRFSGRDFLAAYADVGAVALRLGMSYRFGRAVAAMAHGVVKNECVGHPDRDSSVRRVAYDPTTYGACAEAVAQAVLSTMEARRSGKLVHSDFAIVLRDVDQAVEIEAALLQAKIPYKCDGFDSFLLLPEILMLRGVLHYVSGDYASLKGERDTCEAMVLALSRYFYISRDPENWDSNFDDKKSVLRQAQDSVAGNPSILKDFFEGVLLKAHEFDNPMARQWKNMINPVIREMQGRIAAMTGATVAELLAYLSASVNLQDATSRAFVSRKRAESAGRSLRAFLKFVERHGAMPVAQFLQQLAQMQNSVAVYKKSEHAGKIGRMQSLVRVATIQAAKGREWKYVLMPYMAKSEFMRSSDTQLELRSLYVGMTRTMRELTLFEPDEVSAGLRIAHLAGR